VCIFSVDSFSSPWDHSNANYRDTVHMFLRVKQSFLQLLSAGQASAVSSFLLFLYVMLNLQQSNIYGFSLWDGPFPQMNNISTRMFWLSSSCLQVSYPHNSHNGILTCQSE
jgi:hypothetical protein